MEIVEVYREREIFSIERKGKVLFYTESTSNRLDLQAVRKDIDVFLYGVSVGLGLYVPLLDGGKGTYYVTSYAQHVLASSVTRILMSSLRVGYNVVIL
jgi:hypothetical protein